MKKIPALQDESSGMKKLSSILNKHFASCGPVVVAKYKLPQTESHFSKFLDNSPKTFHFDPDTPDKVESEISLLSLVTWSLFVPC